MMNIIQSTLSEDDLDALSILNAGLRGFRELTGEGASPVPLTIVNTFLLVANKEGRSVTELAKAAGIHNSKMSRQLADLSDTNRYGAPGLGLIVQRHDVYGPRSTNCFLSEKGKALVRRVADSMKRRSDMRRAA